MIRQRNILPSTYTITMGAWIARPKVPYPARIAMHQRACHDGEFDKKCPACKEMKRKAKQ